MPKVSPGRKFNEPHSFMALSHHLVKTGIIHPQETFHSTQSRTHQTFDISLLPNFDKH